MGHILSKNCYGYFLGKFLEKFGFLIPTSGHTAEDPI